MNEVTEEIDVGVGETAPAVDAMARYRTRTRANVPKRINLFDPATGAQTEDWFDIFSSLSDSFRMVRDEVMQGAVQVAQEPDPVVRKTKLYEEQLKMYASLVAGWSFEMPCTLANVVEFFRDAPQIKNMVVAVADDNESFFGSA